MGMRAGLGSMEVWRRMFDRTLAMPRCLETHVSHSVGLREADLSSCLGICLHWTMTALDSLIHSTVWRPTRYGGGSSQQTPSLRSAPSSRNLIERQCTTTIRSGERYAEFISRMRER